MEQEHLTLDEIVRKSVKKHGVRSTEQLNQAEPISTPQIETVTPDGVMHPAFSAHLVYIAVCIAKLAQ